MQLAIRIHSISNVFKKIKLLSRLIDYINYLLFNVWIPANAKIGKGTKLSKGGIAVIIHKRSVIGKNCLIGSCVTIGGRSGIYEVPIIGNNVYISTGAKILGNINIGDNVIIGANSVVINDIPANSTAVGIPAKVIKINEKN